MSTFLPIKHSKVVRIFLIFHTNINVDINLIFYQAETNFNIQMPQNRAAIY